MVNAQTSKLTNLDQLNGVWKMSAATSWLFPELLAEGSVNLLSAESGTGKTWLAYWIAGAVAHGMNVFGGALGPVTQRKVLYVDGENPLSVVQQRLHDLGIPETPSLLIWGGWEPWEPRGPNDALIREFARDEKPLLIWDSLVRFHTGDEQSATETSGFMKHFRNLANDGATVLILHHTGKSESAQEYRGSTDIKAAVDMAFKLSTPGKRGERLDRLVVEPFKCRLVPVPGRTLKFVPGAGFEIDATDALTVIRGIVQGQPGLNQSRIVELAAAAGVGRHKVESVLKSDGFRSERGEKPHEKLWHLADGGFRFSAPQSVG